MIERIIKIENLGRFKAFYGKGNEFEFVENNFIFGKNANGKSTLTSIFESLSKNNPKYLFGRKTFGAENDVQVHLKCKNNIDIVFDGKQWLIKDSSGNSKPINIDDINLKVFDSNYISDNVYNNGIVDKDRQGKITNIILGKKGRDLENEHVKIKNLITENSNKKREITNGYNIVFDKEILSFDKFKDIEKSKIEEANKLYLKIKDDLEVNTNREKINKLFEDIEKIILNLKQIEVKILNNKFENVERDLLNKHVEKNINDPKESIQFLSMGFKLLKGDNCSFCGQEFDENAKKLILELGKAFNDEYKLLNESLKALYDSFSGYKLEEKLLKIQSELIKYKIDLKEEISIFLLSYNKLLDAFLEEVDEKRKNLNMKFDLSKYNELIKEIDLFLEKIIVPIKSKYKNSLSEDKKRELEKTFKKLEIGLNRYDTKWDKLCYEYSCLDIVSKKLLKWKETKILMKKEEYSKSIIEECEKNINEILTKLGAHFVLANITPAKGSRLTETLFYLKFRNYDEKISILGGDDEYSLKNTLSESDKRLLAFAFFVADIKQINNLSDYLIILDDPMSSLDIERKMNTISVIRNEFRSSQSERYGQLIVLTHEENFFKFLCEGFIDKKIFKIETIPKTDSSKISICNMNEDFFLTPHDKRLINFKSCIDNNDFSNCDLSGIRKVIEKIIFTKFRAEIGEGELDGGSSLSWYLEKKCTNDLLKTKIIKDLKIHLPNHEPHKDGMGEENIGDIEREFMINTLFEVIEEI